tara:strand:+ start:17946 stop:18455 length:510 start_codon:yes stop_codon:yes gene_type:complete
MARNFTLNFPSTAFGPASSTTGPTYVNHGTTPFSRIGLAFDDSADETAATGMFVMPSEYTGSGTLKADICYYTASATSGDFAMLVGIEAITDGDSVDMEAANSFDLTATASTKTVPGTAGHPDILTYTLSAKDSVAAGDIVRILILRDVSEDGVSGDVYVASVSFYEET